MAKVPSTPSDQAQGVLAGLRRVGARPSDLARFVHGTTVATNAVLERRGARTVLVTTEGFRDLLEIGRQTRPRLYDLFADRPAPLVPRELVVEAAERVGADGSVLRPLADPKAVAERVRALDAESVAVCLLFSFLYPHHEQAIGDALQSLGTPTSLSSDVLPVFREYERASTTALNAYVAPALLRYLGSLAGSLEAGGMSCALEVMRSGGGTLTAEMAGRLAVHTLLSGPAAGAWGAASAASAASYPDVIAFDMGGTSTDVTLIEAGRPRTSAEGTIDGLPFAVPSAQVHTVGSGGGSVAWRDAGGALRVGPRSAGAEPGPASYGRGGSEPTVTDAYLLLGLLDPKEPLGGVLRLQPGPAGEAVGRLASSLGMTAEKCSAGILRVLEAQVTKALRVVSVDRGRDPRQYALLAFGGAGPLHQGQLARELGCPVVIVPPHPGVLSAIGLLAAPVSVDLVRTTLREGNDLSADQAGKVWHELEAEAHDLLGRQGVTTANVTRSADCRYRGQAFELEVAVSGVASPDPASLKRLARAFEQAHLERYGYAHTGEQVEVVNLRVRAEGPAPTVSPAIAREGGGVESARRGTRTVLLEGTEAECPVFAREAFRPGDGLTGPALVTSADSTCLLLGGQVVEVDDQANLLIREL